MSPLFLIAFLLSPQDTSREAWKLLTAVQKNRDFVNSRFEWTSNLLESGSSHTGVAQYGHEEMLALDYGMVDSNVGPMHSQDKRLWYKNQEWRNTGSKLVVNVDDVRQEWRVDPRSFGLSVVNRKSVRGALFGHQTSVPRHYSMVDPGRIEHPWLENTHGLKVVDIEGIDIDRRFWIDPAKGNSIIMAEMIYNDEVISRVVSDVVLLRHRIFEHLWSSFV